MARSLFLMLALFLQANHLPAQKAEQSYFEWTELPFSKEELAQRRFHLIQKLKDGGASGMVIIPSQNGFTSGETFRQHDDFYYFTGLELPNSLLVVDIDQDESVIYVPENDLRFYSPARPNDFPGRPLLNDPAITSRSGIVLKNKNDLSRHMNEAAKASSTIWLNAGKTGQINLPTQDYITTPSPEQWLVQVLQLRHSGLQFRNSYEAIAKLRMVKSPSEIALLRKATEINVESIIATAKKIAPGKDERYLEGVLEGHYKIKGAQRLAFGSIIKSGPNSLWPWRILATHYDRRNRTMETGELVILDVGCEFDQYVSDVGRTFPVSGRFTDTQREILRMEVGIADQLIAMIKPGITFADLKKLSDDIIPETAKKYMQAGLHFGHHLGLSAGDPNLSEVPLEAGMVFTVEPWYYNHDAQISVFTEDVILVTKTGCEVLSQGLPRTPEDLELLMQE